MLLTSTLNDWLFGQAGYLCIEIYSEQGSSRTLKEPTKINGRKLLQGIVPATKQETFQVELKRHGIVQ